MTTRGVIENKISDIQKYLNLLERYRQFSRQEIEHSVDLRGAVERYLYLAVQATIDLAEALISLKNWRKPQTLGDAFIILAERQVISLESRDKLIKMVGFRNAIAHDYENLDYAVVYDVLINRLVDVMEFLKDVSSKY